MSSEEQDALILYIVKERVAAKRQRTLLESELQAAGKELADLAGSMKRISPRGAPEDTDHLAVLARKADTQFKNITSQLQEYAELDRRIRELDARAKELGID